MYIYIYMCVCVCVCVCGCGCVWFIMEIYIGNAIRSQNRVTWNCVVRGHTKHADFFLWFKTWNSFYVEWDKKKYLFVYRKLLVFELLVSFLRNRQMCIADILTYIHIYAYVSVCVGVTVFFSLRVCVCVIVTLCVHVCVHIQKEMLS